MANNSFHPTNPFRSTDSHSSFNPFVTQSTNPFVTHSANPFVTRSNNPFVDEANLPTREIAGGVCDDVAVRPVVLDPSNFDPSNFDFQGYFEAFCNTGSEGNRVQRTGRLEPEPPRNSSSHCLESPKPLPTPRTRAKPVPRPRHSTALPVYPEHSVESSETLHPAFRDCSIVGETDAASCSGRHTEELLTALVTQFTNVVKEIKEGSSSPATLSSRRELRPPRFDGQSDVHLFLKQFADVHKLNNWEDEVAVVQLRSCLDKAAKECGRAETLSGVIDRLLSMYGLSSSEARERLHNLKRDPGESYVSLGNRVERLARLAYGDLGSKTEMQLALKHFDRALTDVSLRQHLLVLRPRNLEEAVRAAQQFTLVDRPRGRDANVRVVQGGSAPAPSPSIGVTESHSILPGAKVEALLESMTSQLQSLSTRLSAVERSSTPAQKVSKQGCFKCGDLSHFKRNCPILKHSAENEKTGSTVRTPENC